MSPTPATAPAIHRRLSIASRLTGAAVLAGIGLWNPATAHAATQPSPKYKEYVALGDSWSADVVILNKDGLPDSRYAPIDCAQSYRNYPKLVAKALKVKTFRDATCGSATTFHFAHPQTQLPLGGTNPPQYNRLTEKTDLVTVGIGGNDAGVASAVLACLSLSPAVLPLPVETPILPLPLLPTALPIGGCKARFTKGGVDKLAVAIKASEPKLVSAFREIHKRSPKARILAVNYLAGIPSKGCWPLVPITNSDMAYIYSTFLKVNAMIARAAARGHADLVDTYTPSVGHDICASPWKRYVEGITVLSVNELAVALPLHPNSAGAESQARSVLARIRK